jgi:effector-binding domain-containing protein
MAFEAHDENMPFHLALVIPAQCKVWQMPKVIGPAFGRIMDYLKSQKIEPRPTPFVRYYDFDFEDQIKPGLFKAIFGMFTQTWHIDIGFPIDTEVVPAEGMRCVTYRECRVSACVHRGPYRQMSATYRALHQWMTSQGHKPNNESFELYLNDPKTTPQDQLETKIFVPWAS